MAVSCDILIVGGGVMGTSIAFALARRRAGRVVLLEKSHLGAGSSGKSGAIIRQHYSNVLTARMAQKSLRVFEHFEDVVGGPPVFTHTGMVLVVNERDRAGLEANVAGACLREEGRPLFRRVVLDGGQKDRFREVGLLAHALRSRGPGAALLPMRLSHAVFLTTGEKK